MYIHELTFEQLEVMLFTERNLDRKSEEHYRAYFRKIKDFFGSKEFNKENIMLFIAELQKAKYSNNYINKYLTFLKYICWYFDLNFLDHKKNFKQERRVNLNILSPKEIRSIINTKVVRQRRTEEEYKRFSIAIEFIARTGVRIDELVTLEWTDVSGEYVTIRAENNKNDKERTLWLPSDLALKIHSLTRFPEKHNFVFGGINGKMYDNALNKEIQNRARIADVKRNYSITAHIFRHSFITESLDGGVNAAHLSRMVDQTLATTDGYYHGSYKYSREVMDAHPLSIDSLSFDRIKEKVLLFLNKINSDKIMLEYKEDKSILNIEIKFVI